MLILVKLQASLKLTLLHGCFSRFLNCTNATKPRNAPQIKDWLGGKWEWICYVCALECNMWVRAIGKSAIRERSHERQKKMMDWAENQSLRVLFPKEICSFTSTALLVSLPPGNGSETIIFGKKYCGNKLSLTSFTFCVNDTVTVTIVSATSSGLKNELIFKTLLIYKSEKGIRTSFIILKLYGKTFEIFPITFSVNWPSLLLCLFEMQDKWS